MRRCGFGKKASVSVRMCEPERGAAFIEAAFVAPMVLLLFLGMVQFGFAFGVLSQLRSATAVGARVAILGTNQTQSQVCDAAKNSLASLVDTTLLVCETTPTILPAAGNTPVTVTLSYPVRLFSPDIGSTVQLTAHTTMQ
jgi:Flp pilus assembly protein TadG